MEKNSFSRDDVQDVIELTAKLQTAIHEILEDNNTSIGISALINACIYTMLYQCNNMGDVTRLRNSFITIMDYTIRKTKIVND